MPGQAKHLILGVTGSIAAYKSADLVRRLKDADYRVTVVMTPAARQFITPLTMEAVSGEPVYTEMFSSAGPDRMPMPHIRLAQEANGIVIAPATANTIGKLACGLADDLLTCVVLAARVPLIVAPAMNDGMYGHRAVQQNCQTLREAGVHFVEPVEGQLACGSYGKGHLADIDAIVAAVKRAVP